MLRKIFSLNLILLFLLIGRSQGQLIINEFSQGANGTKEYIELVVVGNRTCTGDSCLDIRGWIIDDNNGWFGAGTGQGIAQGHIRFSMNANWSCVPYGSIILLYNAGDKNTTIVAADDPTDANNDNVYVVPSTSNLLEFTNTTPASPSALTYTYPGTVTYNATGDWSTIGLANGGDAVVVVNPANPSIAVHSIAFGSINNGTNATIYFTQSGGATNYYLTNGNYTNVTAYAVGTAPTNETPGSANGLNNANWINQMLTISGGTVHDTIYACITQGGSYNFNGTIINTGGIYIDSFTTTNGCDSLVHLYLNQTQPVSTYNFLEGCNSVLYNGQTYFNSTTRIDTFINQNGCDSAYQHTFITVHGISAVSIKDSVSGCQNVIYNQQTYWVNTTLIDTIKSVSGCDSVYKSVIITVLPIPEIETPELITICEGASVSLTALADYPVTWRGFPVGQNPILVTPTEETEYIVTTMDTLNCVGIAWSRVRLDDFKISLTANKDSVDIKETIEYTSSSNTPYNVLQWYPENIFGTSTSKTQKTLYNKSGTQHVLVTGISENGCIDTANIEIEVLPEPLIFVPNAFSPNGDGINDFFKPEQNRSFIINNFSVYNRFGERVFYAANTQNIKGWDGSYKNKPCDVGIYFFVLSAVSKRGGESIQLKGDVTLLR